MERFRVAAESVLQYPRDKFFREWMMGEKIRIGVVGCGHWGPNHIRNFSNLEQSEVPVCCDVNPDRLKAIKKMFPAIDITTNIDELVGRKDIDAVVVSTPVRHHYEIVKAALEMKKDVLCEKPMTMKYAESKDLVKRAQSNGRILMVGHVFLYNMGIRRIREYIQSGELGRIHYIHCARTNLGPIREDVNAVYDLASHDISICSYLLGSAPENVVAKGGTFLKHRVEDIAFISLSYPSNVIANIHVSWLDPRKVRQITVVGDKKMAFWDDLNASEPIRLYDKGVIQEPYYSDFGEFQRLPREGFVLSPNIKLLEPLKLQALQFVECVRDRKAPMSDGENGAEVVRILNMIDDFIAQHP